MVSDRCSHDAATDKLVCVRVLLQGVIASEEEDQPVAVEETYSGGWQRRLNDRMEGWWVGA